MLALSPSSWGWSWSASCLWLEFTRALGPESGLWATFAFLVVVCRKGF
jgi:hypothetical protein